MVGVFVGRGCSSLAVAALEWWSNLLGLLVLGYAFVKATIRALRLTGHLPKSARQRENEAEDLRMRHHHYHCEKNPAAFERLKADNFRQEQVERSHAESLRLKMDSTNSSGDH